MIAAAEPSVVVESVVSLTKADCFYVIRRMLNWWGIDLHHSAGPKRAGYMVLAVTAHELAEIVYRLERKQPLTTDAATPDPDRIALVRRPVTPWNARTNGRLKQFVEANVDGVVQPPHTYSKDQDGPLVGLDELRRARDCAINAAKAAKASAAKGWTHELIFVRRSHLNTIVYERPKTDASENSVAVDPKVPPARELNRTQLVAHLSDIEHAIAVSDFRVKYRQRCLDHPEPRWKLTDDKVASELRATKKRLRERAYPGRPSQQYDSSRLPASEFACVVAVSDRAGDVTIKWRQSFPGFGAYCLQQLSNLLRFDLHKTKLAKRKRRTTALQFSWVQAAIVRSGDCESERKTLGLALAEVGGEDADPKKLGKDTVIAIASTQGNDWEKEAINELKAVLTEWQCHRKKLPGRVGRKNARMSSKVPNVANVEGAEKKNPVFLDPHERNVWRRARPPVARNRMKRANIQRSHRDMN